MLDFAFAFLLALAPAGPQASLPIDLSEAEQMAAAPDGNSVAWTSAHPGAAALVVISLRSGAKKTYTWSTKELTASLEGSSATTLEWSADGRFLAVELTSSDRQSSIVLADADRGGELKPLLIEGDANLASPRWSGAGHQLFIVPAESSDDSALSAGGIIRYDLDTKKTIRLLERYFVNAFSVSGSVVTALGTDLGATEEPPTDRILRYDLRTGKSETIISRRALDDEAGPKGLSL